MTDSAHSSVTTPAQDVWTVRRVLEWTTGHLKKHGSETPRLDAEILLAHSRECPRIKLYTDYEEPLSDAIRGRMKDLVKRRAAREPVAYLVGHREFFSLDFRVTPDVLIPRPDTETLVVDVLAITKPLESPTILDLCTGSGCVAVATAKNAPGAQVTAVDISPEALEIAAGNASKHGVAERTAFLQGDLFAPLPLGARFDVISANPPYVCSHEIESLDDDVRRYEPRLALDGGTDGLDIARRILMEAPRWLKPGGWVLLEIGPTQFAAVEQAASQLSVYVERRKSKDLSGQWRVWRGRIA